MNKQTIMRKLVEKFGPEEVTAELKELDKIEKALRELRGHHSMHLETLDGLAKPRPVHVEPQAIRPTITLPELPVARNGNGHVTTKPPF